MSFIEMLGPTAVPTIICLVIGFVLLVIEMFLPGIGVAGVSGVVALIAVVVMQLGWGNPRVALYVIAIALLVIILGLIWLIRSFQSGRLSKSFLVLHDQVEGASVPEVASAKADLLGKTGVTITALRPSGMAEIEGARVDVLTSGTFVEKNKPIVVLRAEGMHILVRECTAEELAAQATAKNA